MTTDSQQRHDTAHVTIVCQPLFAKHLTVEPWKCSFFLSLCCCCCCCFVLFPGVMRAFVGWLLACLTSQQHKSVPQGRICSDNWDRSCRSNFPLQPVTVYWHRTNQSQHLPYYTRLLAGLPPECQFLSHWYALTPKKSRLKRDSNPASSALEAGALTTRPTKRLLWGVRVWKPVWKWTTPLPTLPRLPHITIHRNR